MRAFFNKAGWRSSGLIGSLLAGVALLLLPAQWAFAGDGFTLSKQTDFSTVEIKGKIEKIDADSLVVSGCIIFVDAATTVFDDRGRLIVFADLRVGQRVEVKAERRGDGKLWALRIELEDAVNDEVELTGTIEALGDKSLVVAGLNFFVDARTVILDNRKNPIGFADLTAGQIVEIHADRQEDGTLLATRIELEDKVKNEVELKGAIASLGDHSLVVLGLTFLGDQNTAILDNHKNPIAFGDLKVGQFVEIRAVRQTDGTLLATKIKIEDRLGIKGIVANVSGNGLSVAGIAVLFDANTLFRDQSNRLLTSQELRPGELVEVHAVEQTATSTGASSLLALSVTKQSTLTTVETGSSSQNTPPESFVLQQNYPNPFNPSTTIRFEVPASAGEQQLVTLRIYNALGHVVRTLVNQSLKPASYIAVWNGENEAGVKVSSGVYFYEMKAGNFTSVRRMIMAK